MSANDQEYFTPSEAAAYLRVSRPTFHRLVRDGKLPRGRLLTPRRPVWCRAYLDKFFNECPPSTVGADPVPKCAA